jgi:hypothetical protein
MVLGQIGFLTTAAEAFAAAVGAGMLLGSFGAGVLGLLVGHSRRSLEQRALVSGYYGGLLGVALAMLDLVTGYAA